MQNSELHLQGNAQAEMPQSIGQMVSADYRKADVFRKYGIDYCCGGKKTLEEACSKKGLDAQRIQQELDESAQQPSADYPDFSAWAPDVLVSHIVNKHHRYVMQSLPVLLELSAKVARKHGDNNPALPEIAHLVIELSSELQSHLMKEERILFPYIHHMAEAERGQGAFNPPPFGTVENPLHVMEAEHESAGEIMAELRALSDDYTAPEDACTSYRVLFAKLAEFEADLHQHVHLENNILFPRAKAMEQNLRG